MQTAGRALGAEMACWSPNGQSSDHLDHFLGGVRPAMLGAFLRAAAQLIDDFSLVSRLFVFESHSTPTRNQNRYDGISSSNCPRARGQWWLWIYLCRWRLSSGGSTPCDGFLISKPHSTGPRRTRRAKTRRGGRGSHQRERPDSRSISAAPSTAADLDVTRTTSCGPYTNQTDTTLARGHGDGTFRHERASPREREKNEIPHEIPSP